MRRTDKKYLLLLALLVFIQFADVGAGYRRRREGGPSWIERFRDWSRAKIPGLGKPIASSIQMGLNGWAKGEDMTNGALGRLFGGMFPCTLSTKAFICSGVSTKSDFTEMVRSGINRIPSMFLPGIGKDIISGLVEIIVAVVVDGLMGGVPDNPTQE